MRNLYSSIAKRINSNKRTHKKRSTDTEYIFAKYPALTELENSILHFRQIFDEKNPKLLDWFIAIYSKSPIKYLSSFANGLLMDIDAVANSVTSPLSNGFVEGNNNRLKVIKRVMYGRAGTPLLTAKVVAHRSNSVYIAYG